MQFLMFCAAVLRAVDKWQGLLRASIASAGNDHRLGANEAPPAILSVFLGDQLTDIFDQIEKGAAKSTKQGGTLALDSVATELEGALARGGEELNKAVRKLLTKIIKEHKRIVFNGNNYAPEWEKEAGKRKLLNLKHTVDALPQLISKNAVKLLDKYKILNEREVHAQYEVFLENYNKTINVEGQLMVLMANRYILPAALEYQKQIGQSVSAVKSAGGSSVQGKKLLAKYTTLVDQLKAQTDTLSALLDHNGDAAEKHATYMRDKIVPAMAKLRDVGDQIEVLTPHDAAERVGGFGDCPFSLT